VILINLLPHREERRRRRKIAFFVGLAFSAVVGLAVVGAWYLVVEQLVASQQQRNQFLNAEIKKLEVQIKDIATLRAEIGALKSRQRAVEDLQIDRNVPVHILNELVRQTPEGIYLTSVKQDNQTLSVSGVAQTQERVSEFLRNTANNSTWLEKPILGSIKATTVTVAGTRDQRRMFEFAMGVTLKRPPAPGAAASGASAPAAASAVAVAPVPAATASAPVKR